MKSLLQNLADLSDEEVASFISLGVRKFANSKIQISPEGIVFDKLFFIHSGIIRCFQLIDGIDITYAFFTTNEFATDFESYLTGEPSLLTFETLSDTEYSIFHKKDIEKLYQTHPKFEKIGRLFAENAFLKAAKRLKEHQTDTLKIRYLNLLARNPQLFQDVPQYHIASYLGVKPQSLSRIRTEIANDGISSHL